MSIASRIKNFLGLTDNYSGQLPVIQDNLFVTDAQRRSRYAAFWREYQGAEVKTLVQSDGTEGTSINILQRNINKVNYFFCGNGFSINHQDFQAQIEVAEKCWGAQKLEKLMRIAQFGAVTGDCFVMVAPSKVAEAIVNLNKGITTLESDVASPSDVRIVAINSAYCTPTYDAFDSDALIQMDISIPFQQVDNQTVVTKIQRMVITRAEVVTYVTDQSGAEDVGTKRTEENPIKQVYVVHIRNFPIGDSIFGESDIPQVRGLNRAYTDRLNDVGQVVAYHASPIISIFGAKASSLQRGANRVWGNLPKDGKVEMLTMQGEMEASNKYLETLYQRMNELMGVPEIAQGSNTPISNTSGVALHTMYMPLVERARTKQNIYSPYFLRIYSLAFRWLYALNLMPSEIEAEEIGGLDVSDLPAPGEKSATDKPVMVKIEPMTEEDYEDFMVNSVVIYESPLPKDELIQIQVQDTRVKAGLQSKRRALIALGEQNPGQLLAEIEAEKQRDVERNTKLGLDATGNPIPPPKVDTQKSPVNSGAGAGQGETKSST